MKVFEFNLELFRMKYEGNWVHMYEIAKVSVNNRGNELKSSERRSTEQADLPNRVLDVTRDINPSEDEEIN